MRSILPVLLVAAIPALAGAQPAVHPPNVLADATAEVQVAPDRAVIRFGVQHQSRDARAAQAQVGQAMEKVIAAVRDRGVQRDRIATERLELHPVYDHRERAGGGEGPVLVGFRAANVVRVELPIERGEGAPIGQVIDAAIGAGANTVDGIQFELADPTPHELRAMDEAAARARARAERLARALGVRLGGLLEVREGGADVEPPRPFAMARMEASSPVEPGLLTVRATVTLRYAIEGR